MLLLQRAVEPKLYHARGVLQYSLKVKTRTQACIHTRTCSHTRIQTCTTQAYAYHASIVPTVPYAGCASVLTQGKNTHASMHTHTHMFSYTHMHIMQVSYQQCRARGVLHKHSYTNAHVYAYTHASMNAQHTSIPPFVLLLVSFPLHFHY